MNKFTAYFTSLVVTVLFIVASAVLLIWLNDGIPYGMPAFDFGLIFVIIVQSFKSITIGDEFSFYLWFRDGKEYWSWYHSIDRSPLGYKNSRQHEKSLDF